MERKKHWRVDIITIYDPYPNYGNRLQNFAVQEVLKNMGFDVVTISFEKKIILGSQKLKYYIQYLSGNRLPGNKEYWKLKAPKIMAFEKFNKKYINTIQIKSVDEIRHADYYVIGSDQVWNPEWYGNCPLKKDMFLLTFAKPEQKVCFSPSFGVETLPVEWIPWFKKCLETFPYISVREMAGAQIIKELTGNTAEVLIDPTLMLDAEKWKSMSYCPKDVDCQKNYILVYFLGGLSEKAKEDIDKYALELGAEVYNLLEVSQPALYKTDPFEFVYLISKAKLIITDSFHACVFSFIFHKPFLVYDRKGTNSMMSRMDTFLYKFDLRRKYVFSGLSNELTECNYKAGYDKLKIERDKVMSFLKQSMNL